MSVVAAPSADLSERWRQVLTVLAPDRAAMPLSAILREPACSYGPTRSYARLEGHLQALEALKHHCSNPYEVACALFLSASASVQKCVAVRMGRGDCLVKDFGICVDAAGRIERLVDCLLCEATVDCVDAAVATDAKYWILGAPASEYDDYARQVRAFCPQVTDVAFCLRRLARLRSYGRRGQIFRCPELGWEHELRAHKNIAGEIATLRAMQAAYRAKSAMSDCD